VPKLLNNLDFNKYEARNMRLQNLGASPGTPVKGQLYFDTGTNKGYIYDGTTWQLMGAGTVTNVTGTAPITSSGGATPAIGITAATSGAAGSMSAADKSKIDGISAGATVNSPDATLLNRANHTGTQAISTVSGLQTALDAKIATTLIGAANGLATLDGSSKIPSTQLPAIGLTDVNVVADYTARNALVVQEGDVAIVTGTGETFIYDGAAWQLMRTPIDGVTAVTGFGVISSTGGNTPQISLVSDSITSAYLAGNSVGVSELDAANAGAGLTGGSGLALAVGAGIGIISNANDVAIDTAVVARKFAASVGDGTATTYVVTHNLNTRDVTVGIYLNSGTYEEVLADVEHTSVNTITVYFAVAPSTNAYRVVVRG